MKERIINIFVPITIVYMSIIVILMLITYNKMYVNVEFPNNQTYHEELNKYKNEINLLSNKECQNALNDLANFLDKYALLGNVNIKNYLNNSFNEEKYILSYYSKIKNGCPEVTDEKASEYDLPTLFLTSSVLNDELIMNNILNYEISFEDTEIRNIVLASFTSTESNIKLNNDLKIIKYILEIINSEEVKDEN